MDGHRLAGDNRTSEASGGINRTNSATSWDNNHHPRVLGSSLIVSAVCCSVDGSFIYETLLLFVVFHPFVVAAVHKSGDKFLMVIRWPKIDFMVLFVCLLLLKWIRERESPPQDEIRGTQIHFHQERSLNLEGNDFLTKEEAARMRATESVMLLQSLSEILATREEVGMRKKSKLCVFRFIPRLSANLVCGFKETFGNLHVLERRRRVKSRI